MIRSPEIKVNPDVLKALRESSGYTVEEIAKKIKTSTNRGTQKKKVLNSLSPRKSKKTNPISFTTPGGAEGQVYTHDKV
jgi:hypothetical protein